MNDVIVRKKEEISYAMYKRELANLVIIEVSPLI